MSIRIALMPWWGRAGVYAGFTVFWAGVFLAIMRLEGHRSVTSPTAIVIATAAALPVGAVLGVLVGWSTRSYSYRDALRPLTPAERSWAITGLWRGPLPEDPRVQAATARLAWLYLRPWRSRGTKNAVAMAALGVFWIMAALWGLANPELGEAVWQGVFGVCVVGLAAWSWFVPRRVERRLAHLGASPNSR